MAGLFEVVLANSLGGLLLASVAMLAGRYLRRSAVTHGLWVLVLLKLISPPLLQVGALPSPFARALTTPQSFEGRGGELAGAATDVQAASVPNLDWEALVLWLWLVPAAVLFVLAAARTARFLRLLKSGEPAGGELRLRLESLARRMGIQRPPEIRLVDSRLSPMLWTGWRRRKLVLPTELFYGRLGAKERDTLLAHELAHFKRRDHWVRYLELLTGCLFWWHPVSWWARRRIRQAEERCCDELVAATLPRCARSYADCLLKTAEFVTGSPSARPLAGPASPAFTGGAAALNELKERLTMIMTHKPNTSPKPRARGALVLLALPLLALSPSWVRGSLQEREEFQRSRERALAEKALLDEQEVELQHQQREIDIRRLQIDHELERSRSEQLQLQLLGEADELAARGDLDGAEALRKKAAHEEEASFARQERIRLKEELLWDSGLLERELRSIEAQIEAQKRAGDGPPPVALAERVAELEAEYRSLMKDLEEPKSDDTPLKLEWAFAVDESVGDYVVYESAEESENVWLSAEPEVYTVEVVAVPGQDATQKPVSVTISGSLSVVGEELDAESGVLRYRTLVGPMESNVFKLRELSFGEWAEPPR